MSGWNGAFDLQNLFRSSLGADWVWRPACFCSVWQDSRAKWGRYSGTFIKKTWPAMSNQWAFKLLPKQPLLMISTFLFSREWWWWGRDGRGARNHLKSQKLKPVSGACGSEGGPPKQICMNSSGYGNVIELHCRSHWIDVKSFQLMGHNNIHMKIRNTWPWLRLCIVSLNHRSRLL